LLESVLRRFRDEGKFRTPTLGAVALPKLMAASRSALSWTHYEAIDAGRSALTDLARVRPVPSFYYGDPVVAIQAQLIAWGVAPPERLQLQLSPLGWPARAVLSNDPATETISADPEPRALREQPIQPAEPSDCPAVGSHERKAYLERREQR